MFKNIIGLFANRSLFTKLMISIVSCIVVCFVVFAIILSNYLKPVIQDQIVSKANTEITNAIFYIYKDINIAEQAIHTTAKILSEQENIDTNYLLDYTRATLRSLYDKYKFFHSIWIYVIPENENEKGMIYQSIVDNNKIVPTIFEETDEISTQQWKTETLRTEGFCWTEPFEYKELNGDIFFATSVSVPFYEKGKVKGIIAIAVDLRQLQDRVSKISFDGDGKLLLLSQKGKYVVHPDKNIQMQKTIFDLAKEQNLPQLQIAGEDLSKNKSGFIMMPKSSVFDTGVAFVYAPIPKLRWGACLVFSSKPFFQPAIEIQKFFVIFSVVGIIVLIIIINLICRYITNPLKRLTIVVEKYANGVFSNEIPIDISNKDEVGTLTKAFINMKNNLSKLIKDKQQQAVAIQKKDSEIDFAKKLQKSVLDMKLPTNPYICLSCSMIPAKEVGGDFYDFFFVNEKEFVFLISDISGKGIPAALFMMKTKELIRRYIEKYSSLSQAMNMVNNEICSINNSKLFVTAFIAKLNIETGIVEYININHNAPLLKTEQEYKYLEINEKVALGKMNNMSYNTQQIQLEKNSSFFLYTDGVVKITEKTDEISYGCKNLQDCLNKEFLSPENAIENVKKNISDFSDKKVPNEDMAMLCLTYLGKNENKNKFVVQATEEQENKVLDFIKNDMQSKNISLDNQEKILSISKQIFENISCYSYKNIGNVWIDIEIIDNEYQIMFSDFGQEYNPLENIKYDIEKVSYIREFAQNKVFISLKI